MPVKIGTCGWSASRSKYYERFRVVEIQRTFYKLPRSSTAEKWRREAPVDFEFSVKAWQVLTHSPRSPTWRKSGLEAGRGEADRYGLLRPTEENFRAWERVAEVCEILRARVCVFQTPPSFGYSEENASRVEAFFSSIDRRGLVLAWEPRGTWREHLDAVERLCESLDLVHVVDVLRLEPARVGDIAYFRLHGLGGREVNYRYKYTDEDLARLAELVSRYGAACSEVYVMFNNVYMFDDASRLKELLRERYPSLELA